MLRFRVIVSFLFLSTMVCAQQPASQPVPRLCVANIKNESKLDISMSKLRDLLVSQLKQGNLARNSRLEVLPLGEDTEDKAAPEANQQHCDYAVYQRLLMFRVPAPAIKTESSVVYKADPRENGQQLVPGIQFTVVRVQSGIPILIDRRAAQKPYTSDTDMLPLLQPIGDRIQTELEKRLLAPAKPGI